MLPFRGVFLPTNPPKHMSRNQRYPYLASQPAYGVVVVLVIPKKADVSCAAYLSSGQPPTHHGQGQARPARRTAVDQQLALSLSLPAVPLTHGCWLLATARYFFLSGIPCLLGAPWRAVVAFVLLNNTTTYDESGTMAHPPKLRRGIPPSTTPPVPADRSNNSDAVNPTVCFNVGRARDHGQKRVLRGVEAQPRKSHAIGPILDLSRSLGSLSLVKENDRPHFNFLFYFISLAQRRWWWRGERRRTRRARGEKRDFREMPVKL